MATAKKPSLADTIKANNKELGARLAAGDAKGMAALYTKSAVLMAPDVKACKGAKAIANYWNSIIAMGIKSASLRTVDLEQHGTTAIERGEATLKGGTTIKAKYVVVWKREGKDWKLHIDIFNFNPAT
jgi:ketosteroid isomerase-like protein